MLFYPERVALTGLFFYLALWLVAPLNLVFPVSWGSLNYIFWCYLAFFLGCLMMAGRRRHRIKLKSNEPKFRKQAFFWVVTLGALGIFARIFDKWFLRGAGVGSSALESRELLVDVAAGPLAALGGLLYPFCYVPLIMWWSRPTGTQVHSIAKWVAVFLFILPGLDALMLLSRSQMLVAFSMMYFAAACVLYQGHLLPRKLFLPILLGVSGMMIISIVAFLIRLDQMNMDLIFSIQNSVYGYVTVPGPSILWLMQKANNTLGIIFTSIIPIIQYYLHGLFEFGLLWDRSDVHQIFTFGAQHFAPYLKALSIFGISPGLNLIDSNIYYRTGVFTTFFGPLWVDFSWGGILFMLGFGAFVKYCAESARAGHLGAMPLHAYFCVVLFFMPVVNFVVSAQGMYIINALVFFWFFSKK